VDLRSVGNYWPRPCEWRSATEAVIGHCKTDGHLNCNFFKGHHGDHTNAVLTAVGYNLRITLKWLKLLLRLISQAYVI
jgi:IS5 family transposase